MNRRAHAPEASLATPPSSTYIKAHDPDYLPELELGPSSISTRKAAGATGKSKKGKPSRKTTHSQIEKRRREKINDTMERLKNLVPACHDDPQNLRKLDVLTATADYIEELKSMLQLPSPRSPIEAHSRMSTTMSESSREDHDHVVDAATSLIKIAESPVIGPIVNRLSIAELMHL